jgi:hypothetical protein
MGQDVGYAAHIFNAPSGTFMTAEVGSIQRIVRQATKIEGYRHKDLERCVSAILENMGFEKMEARRFTRVLSPLISGEMDVKVVNKTSELGRLLREVGHRQKAFETIALHQESVSESVLEDVARPVNAELRSKAEQQASELMSGKTSPSMQSGLYSLGHQILSLLNYVNTKVLNLPVASAESQSSPSDPCADLLSEECFKEISTEKLNRMRDTVTQQIDNVRGKHCIRVLGYAGAGKSTFINYLFSNLCSADLTGINCDSTPALTGGENTAATEYIQTYRADGLIGFSENTVVVDLPGFLGSGNHALSNLIQSMLAVKSIIKIDEVAQSVVDVVVVEYDSLLAKRGDLEVLKTSLNLDKSIPNRVMIITKVPPSPKAWSRQGINPDKESLRKALKERGIDQTLIDHLILYDVADEDLALNPSSNSGGGSNKAAIVRDIISLQKGEIDRRDRSPSAPPTVGSARSLTSPQMREYFSQIRKKLAAALEKKSDRTEGNQLSRRVNSLLEISLPELITEVENVINNTDCRGIEFESQIKFRGMLDTGDARPFLQYFHKQLLPYKDNVLLKDCFNFTGLIHGYVNQILGANHVHKGLTGSPVIKNVSHHFPDFMPVLEQRIKSQLHGIIAQFREAISECSPFTDEESKRWKEVIAILGLNASDNDYFGLLESYPKRIKEIQEKFPKEKEKVINDHLEMARNRILGILVLVGFFASRHRRREVASFHRDEHILNGVIAGVPVHFVEAGETVQEGQYNQWETEDGVTLTLAKRNDSNKHVLIRSGEPRLLRPINMVQQTDRRLQRLEACIEDINRIAPLRTSEIALICTSILTSLASFPLISQLGIGASFYWQCTRLNQASINAVKSYGLDALLFKLWGVDENSIHSEACARVLGAT